MSDTHKILIVEDDKPIQKIVNEKLLKLGYDVHQAWDGHQGLKMALEHKPDLILLDILMPEMNGLELLEELRKDDWGAKVPILFFTNLDYEVNEEELNAYSFDKKDFILKSNMSIHELLVRIRECLDR